MMVYAKLIRAVCTGCVYASITKQVLIDRRVLASAMENDRKSFDVCTPNYTAEHRSKKYRNDFSAFTQYGLKVGDTNITGLICNDG